MIDQLKSLAVFAKTVELGSFREASRALALSPSVVSHHVTQLEKQLGVPLLYRTTRRLALTPDGEKLHTSARDMLAAAERGLDAINGRAHAPSGLLRMTAPAFLAETDFVRDVADFSNAHPRVQLRLAFDDARRELLASGLDLALRFGKLDDSTLKARKLAEMRRVLVAAPRYLRERDAPHALADLVGWDFLQLSTRAPEIALVAPGKKTTSTLAFVPRIAVDSATAMRAMALAGVGVAGLPEVLVRADLARGRLALVLPGWRMPSIPVYAVWPDNAQKPELTLRFVAFMAERVDKLFADA